MTDRLRQLQDFLKASPDDSFLIFAIAKEYEKEGEQDKAMQHYLELKSKDPEYVGLYYHLGKLYEEKENFDLAIETYHTGMDVAKSQGDKHAFNELAGAKMNIDDE